MPCLNMERGSRHPVVSRLVPVPNSEAIVVDEVSLDHFSVITQITKLRQQSARTFCFRFFVYFSGFSFKVSGLLLVLRSNNNSRIPKLMVAAVVF